MCLADDGWRIYFPHRSNGRDHVYRQLARGRTSSANDVDEVVHRHGDRHATMNPSPVP